MTDPSSEPSAMQVPADELAIGALTLALAAAVIVLIVVLLVYLLRRRRSATDGTSGEPPGSVPR